MFLSTGWKIDEENATETIAQKIRPQEGDYELCLLKRFDFNSAVMRASSIVMYSSDKQVRSFVKGAPEKIKELCLPNSVPSNYDAINEEYTKNGYRVIALASKLLEGVNE